MATGEPDFRQAIRRIVTRCDAGDPRSRLVDSSRTPEERQEQRRCGITAEATHQIEARALVVLVVGYVLLLHVIAPDVCGQNRPQQLIIINVFSRGGRTAMNSGGISISNMRGASRGRSSTAPTRGGVPSPGSLASPKIDSGKGAVGWSPQVHSIGLTAGISCRNHSRAERKAGVMRVAHSRWRAAIGCNAGNPYLPCKADPRKRNFPNVDAASAEESLPAARMRSMRARLSAMRSAVGATTHGSDDTEMSRPRNLFTPLAADTSCPAAQLLAVAMGYLLAECAARHAS